VSNPSDGLYSLLNGTTSFICNEQGAILDWGLALVPTCGSLLTGGDAEAGSLSCASASDCTAGGNYTDAAGAQQASVTDETASTWGTEQQVPGSGALNAGGHATVESVSCASAGNCAAGGYYTDSSGHLQAFVASETAGTWSTAQQLPGTATLNADGSARVNSVSCGSAGNCAAGGYYTDSSGHQQAFVADETAGTWSTARQLPGTATLNAGGSATVVSVSCTGAAGNCAAGGNYTDAAGNQQAFVADETSGTWGAAQQLSSAALPAALLNAGGPPAALRNAGVLAAALPGAVVTTTTSQSCASPGNCASVGYYTNAAGDKQVWVDDEKNGVWGGEQQLPGSAALNKGKKASLDDVSCAGAVGNCATVGYYTDADGALQAWVADEKNGAWGNAQQLPGTAVLNAGGAARLLAVSCSSAQNCVTGGYYDDAPGAKGRRQTLLDEEKNGAWGNAEQVPGTAQLNVGGDGRVVKVSCSGGQGFCRVTGLYVNVKGLELKFVSDQKNGVWGNAQAY
jgi:hypothetical protein